MSYPARAEGLVNMNKPSMIKCHENGEKLISIAQSFSMSWTIVINKKRRKIFEEMEQLLSLWIDKLNHQCAAISQKSFNWNVVFV